MEMLIKYLQKDNFICSLYSQPGCIHSRAPTAAITLPSSAWSHNAHIFTFSTESKSIEQPQKLHLPQGKFTQAELSHRVEPWWTLSEDVTQSVKLQETPKTKHRNTEFRQLCSAETESRARCRWVMVYIADAWRFHWTVLKCLWFGHKVSRPTFNCSCGISPSTLWREQTHEEIKTNFKSVTIRVGSLVIRMQK